jgi:hypothetical protein
VLTLEGKRNSEPLHAFACRGPPSIGPEPHYSWLGLWMSSIVSTRRPHGTITPNITNINLKGKRIMNTLHKKLLVVAAAAIVWTAIQPGIVSAQTSGVGNDGYTRVLWRATDGSISLWKLDGNLTLATSHAYGPYPGWVPIAITVAENDNTYVLWRYTDGSISLWEVDSNLNLVTSHVYGPYTGWIAQGISSGGPGSLLRVIWRYTTGTISIWRVDPSLNLIGSQVYGPYFGYDPGAP